MNRSDRLFIGLDLGQQYDYTALVALSSEMVANRDLKYTVEYIHRYPLKMSYPDMTASVGRFIDDLRSRRYSPILVVDYTGVGAPVYDMLSKQGCKPVAFTITGGNQPNIKNKFKVSVPKIDMVACLQVAIQNKKLKIPSTLKELKQLKAEIQNFHMKISAGASTSFGALRDSVHDDIVMSLCMVLWYAEYLLVGKRSPFIKVGI